MNFDKQSSSTTTTYNVEYDYGSVMHYSASAFTRNGQPTIIPKVSLIYCNSFNILNRCVHHNICASIECFRIFHLKKRTLTLKNEYLK